MDFGRISRRHLLQGGAALTLGSAFGARSAQAADTTIGFIYVGSRDDYGYNQAHAQGAAALKKLPGLKVVEEEKVPETDAVEKTIESMINLDGATLLFPTSFGYYNPHMIKMAKKFPKLRFEHCGGLWSDKDPANAGSYFGYIDEAQFISGIVAGYSTKSGKLGFVAAKPGDLGEHLPATPFVFWAYAVVWLVVVAYVLSLWRRITKAEREIAAVAARLESKG